MIWRTSPRNTKPASPPETHAAGISDQRDHLARALDHCCRSAGRNSCRSVRNWWRGHHCSRAVRGVPGARGARGCPHPGLYWNVARNHCSHDGAVLSRSQEKGVGVSRGSAYLGAAGDRGRCNRIASGFVRACFCVQDRLSGVCHLHCDPHAVWWRTLETWRPAPRAWHACDLRSGNGAFLVSRWRQRRRHLECGPHTLWAADASGGRNIGGCGRAHHDCRHDWLHACWVAAHGAAATFVDWLRLAGRLGFDGTGLKLHDKLWRAAGAFAAAPQTRDRIWNFSDRGRVAFCGQYDLAGFVQGVPRMRSLSPRTSQLSRRLRKLIPSKLFLRCPACTTRAGTARSVSPPTATRSSVTAAARVRPLAVSMFTE